MQQVEQGARPASKPFSLDAYIAIARPDHWFKNVFVLPGAALAMAVTGNIGFVPLWNILLAVIATCLIASANYTINEWLDAEFDQHHPIKKHRPSVSGGVKAKFVYIQYALLSITGLGLGFVVSPLCMYALLFLLIMGVAYNVRPMRTKDRAYLDVISESINNPIRFMIGWFAVVTTLFPPSSILLAYWTGGAFLMATKRFAEYRYIGDPDRAGLYRASFKHYTEERLLLSSFFYALVSAFFFGVFLIKYKIELILVCPFLAFLFTWYFQMSLAKGSTAQTPEKLYKEKKFVAFVGLLSALVIALVLIDIPYLEFLTEYVVTGE